MIVSIDPGPTFSGYVVYDGEKPVEFAKVGNQEMLRKIDNLRVFCDLCVIEMIGHYGTGLPAGKTVFDTCVWIGRFTQAFGADRTRTILRPTVKAHLCHSARAKDGNVRQAIIDRYGGKDVAIGRKSNPGPLYGMAGDTWSALAVALAWADMNVMSTPAPGTLAAIFAAEGSSYL